MKRISILRAVPVTITVLLVIIGSVGALSAEGANPFDEVLAKLDEIIGVLTPPPTDAEVTLASSLVSVITTQHMGCTAVNIGTENVEGVLRVIGPVGVIVENPVVLTPGEAGSILDTGTGLRRCEFTFVGTASSVRANLLVRNDADSGLVAVAEMR
jgi:hypothetical protein